MSPLFRPFANIYTMTDYWQLSILKRNIFEKLNIPWSPVAKQNTDNTLLVANLSHSVEMVNDGQKDKGMDHNFVQLNLRKNHFYCKFKVWKK